jgi:hypothetical protein
MKNKYSNYLVEKGKLELVGNWSMISDPDKLDYFKKFQQLSKDDKFTINLTMQSSNPTYRKKKLEEFDICWKAHKDTLANLFKYWVPDFSKIENEFYDDYEPVPQLNQQESQLKIQMESILRLESMISKKDNKIEVLTKNVNKLMMENRELNTTVYMNEVAIVKTKN